MSGDISLFALLKSQQAVEIAKRFNTSEAVQPPPPPIPSPTPSAAASRAAARPNTAPPTPTGTPMTPATALSHSLDTLVPPRPGQAAPSAVVEALRAGFPAGMATPEGPAAPGMRPAVAPSPEGRPSVASMSGATAPATAGTGPQPAAQPGAHPPPMAEAGGKAPAPMGATPAAPLSGALPAQAGSLPVPASTAPSVQIASSPPAQVIENGAKSSVGTGTLPLSGAAPAVVLRPANAPVPGGDVTQTTAPNPVPMPGTSANPRGGPMDSATPGPGMARPTDSPQSGAILSPAPSGPGAPSGTDPSPAPGSWSATGAPATTPPPGSAPPGTAGLSPGPADPSGPGPLLQTATTTPPMARPGTPLPGVAPATGTEARDTPPPASGGLRPTPPPGLVAPGALTASLIAPAETGRFPPGSGLATPMASAPANPVDPGLATNRTGGAALPPPPQALSAATPADPRNMAPVTPRSAQPTPADTGPALREAAPIAETAGPPRTGTATPDVIRAALVLLHSVDTTAASQAAFSFESRAAAAGVILNAAMIPGWPFPSAFARDTPRFDPAALRELGQKLVAMTPEELAEYIAKIGGDHRLLRRIRRFLKQIDGEEGAMAMGFLAMLGAAMGQIARALSLPMALAAEEIAQLADSADGRGDPLRPGPGGPRRRLRL